MEDDRNKTVTEMGAEGLCALLLSLPPPVPPLFSSPPPHTHLLPSRYTEEMPPAILGDAEIKLTKERNES